MAQRQRLQGEVKWFNIAKGFGFITTEGIKEDIYVHHHNAPKDKTIGTRRLLVGQIVSFELGVNSHGGYEAFEVTIDQSFIVS